MRKKGQSIIFEHVLLFSISVVIFIISFAVFSIYQNIFVSANSANQLDGTKEWVSAHILKVAQHDDSVESLLIIPIPQRNGDSAYDIQLTNNGLEIENIISGAKSTSTLFFLNESFTLSGNVSSINGRVIIKREDEQIIIS